MSLMLTEHFMFSAWLGSFRFPKGLSDLSGSDGGAQNHIDLLQH